MTKASVTGTVDRKTVMTPIVWDSPGEEMPVADTTVETALKICPRGADVLGFQFSQAVRYKLTEEDGTEVKFSRRNENPEKYLFATKVLGTDDVAELRAGKGALADAFNRIPSRLRDEPANVFFDSDIGLQYIRPEYRGTTILIDRKGQQLYPAPKA